MRVHKVAILALVLLTQAVHAQNPVKSSSNVQIEEITRANRFLKEDLARTQSQLDKLQKENNELSDKFDRYEPLLENWKSIFGLFGFTSLTLLGVAAWLKFRKLPAIVKEIVDQVPTIAQREYETKIAQLFTDRRADLIALLKDYDVEQEIKKNNRVVLLTHKNGADNFHHELLTRHGFNVKAYTNVEVLAVVADELTLDDIIVINNEGGHWVPEEVSRFVHNNPFNCFYIGRGVMDLNGEALNRFAAANFRAQFIGNLMNILRYKN